MKYKTEVFCSLQVDGLHRWKECPFEEVAYLRDLHRHMFHIKCYKNVNHSDRDTEFIILKHQVMGYFKDTFYEIPLRCCNFGEMSCEMIAERLIEFFNLSRCEVSEDGENGAIVHA